MLLHPEFKCPSSSLTVPERLLLNPQNPTQTLGSLSQTRDSRPLAPPPSDPGDWTSGPSSLQLRAGSLRQSGGGAVGGGLCHSREGRAYADSVHLFGLRGLHHDPGQNALGLGVLGLLIAEPKGGRHRDTQRHGRGGEPKWIKWGQRDRDAACYPYPLPTHLVEEVDGGQDGEYSYGQGYILGGRSQRSGSTPSLPFLPTSLPLPDPSLLPESSWPWP